MARTRPEIRPSEPDPVRTGVGKARDEPHENRSREGDPGCGPGRLPGASTREEEATLDPLQVAGAALGLAYVWLAIREIPWCWPAGIANAVLFLVVYANARIYGAAGLQAVYVVVSIYGWYEWLHGGADHGRLGVSRTPARWGVGLAVLGFAASLALGLFLKHRTNAALPLPDAAVTAFSLVAQWMATRKWLENWLVWIVLNLANVTICISQRLYPMSALYAVFLVLAVLGYREWRRSMGRGPNAIAGEAA